MIGISIDPIESLGTYRESLSASTFRQLQPGWTRTVEGLGCRTRSDIEWLVALPVDARRAAALSDELEPTPELAQSLLDVATAARGVEPAEACSLAEVAQRLTGRLSARGQDCRFLFDSVTEYWVESAEMHATVDQLRPAIYCLNQARHLSGRSGEKPARVARIALTQAYLHWKHAELEACLTELEVATIYCELANDQASLASALLLQGMALAAVGKIALARESLERCFVVASEIGQEETLSKAERTLESLNELL